jgi:glycine/D-amino acid oxidase-like deaminating enzyme
VVLCSACSGHGFKMSSAIGEQLARLAAAGGPGGREEGPQGPQGPLAMHRLDAARPGHAAALAAFLG